MFYSVKHQGGLEIQYRVGFETARVVDCIGQIIFEDDREKCEQLIKALGCW